MVRKTTPSRVAAVFTQNLTPWWTAVGRSGSPVPWKAEACAHERLPVAIRRSLASRVIQVDH
jgi:hypothetical protein